MYYKIENKECEVYKQLFELRTKELQYEKDNKKAIDEKTGLKWQNSFGHHGQQNFSRVSSYSGFEFKEVEKVDLKIWKEHKDYSGIFIPNTRTKLGREMQDFLQGNMQRSNYNRVFEILKVETGRKFTLPYVEITKDKNIILFLGYEQEPKDKNIIEITKRDFKNARL